MFPFSSRSLIGTETEAPIKQCPVCRIYIERNEGCAQMMCKNCKHTFCWYCLQNLDVSAMEKKNLDEGLVGAEVSLKLHPKFSTNLGSLVLGIIES